MKHLCIIVVAVLISATSFGQDNDTTIEVQGVAEYTREVDRLQAEITVSPDNYYSYDQRDKPTLDELNKIFFEEMEKNGFDKSRFKLAKKPKYFSSQGEEMTVYQFETASETELDKLIRIKRLNGIYVSGGLTFYKPLSDHEKIIAIALEDAKKNAEAVAAAMGKTVDRVVSVSDQSRVYTSQTEGYYDATETGKYYLYVKFSTK